MKKNILNKVSKITDFAVKQDQIFYKGRKLPEYKRGIPIPMDFGKNIIVKDLLDTGVKVVLLTEDSFDANSNSYSLSFKYYSAAIINLSERKTNSYQVSISYMDCPYKYLIAKKGKFFKALVSIIKLRNIFKIGEDTPPANYNSEPFFFFIETDAKTIGELSKVIKDVLMELNTKAINKI